METIAKKYLDYVYIGNVSDVDRNIYGLQCKEEIIDINLTINMRSLNEKRCKKCGKNMPIVC